MAVKKLTPEEWAEIQRQPVTAVRRQIRQGRIHAVNVGTKGRPEYRIPETELDRYDKANAAA